MPRERSYDFGVFQLARELRREEVRRQIRLLFSNYKNQNASKNTQKKAVNLTAFSIFKGYMLFISPVSFFDEFFIRQHFLI